MDLYVVLGVRHGASDLEIKRAYRRLARRYHPDINPGDREAAERFRQILDAYETLTDPERRVRYEAGAAAHGQAPRRPTGFEGFDFSARAVDYSASFGDLFAEVLNERATRPPERERGVDLHQEVALTFQESLTGAVRVLTVTRRESCASCAGTGKARVAPRPCGVCAGSGTVQAARGHMIFSQACRTCAGSGTAPPSACPACSGAGQETRAEAVSIRIPAGIHDEERVRVSGKGHAGVAGGPPGDLFVTVHVAGDAKFRREGDELHLVVPIAVHEAALGTRLEIVSFDGPAKLRIPPGTQSGQRFRVRERGAPSTRTGLRGDLIVEVQLMLPSVLDERSKELLREFGRLNGDSVRERW